jgi:hypothetical protein
MGIFGDIYGGIAKMIGSQERKRNAETEDWRTEQNTKNYYGDKNNYLHALKGLDFQPAYAGDAIGPYKRSESPVARAYLESLLTGDNPQAAASPWSTPTDQVAAKQGFEGRYGGGYDKLLAKGESERSETPWETKTPGKVDTKALKGVKPYKAPLGSTGGY